jgi:hypothetical protein
MCTAKTGSVSGSVRIARMFGANAKNPFFETKKHFFLYSFPFLSGVESSLHLQHVRPHNAEMQGTCTFLFMFQMLDASFKKWEALDKSFRRAQGL